MSYMKNAKTEEETKPICPQDRVCICLSAGLRKAHCEDTQMTLRSP